MGAAGSVDAPLSLAPWLHVDLFNAWEAGATDRAVARQQEVDIVQPHGAAAHTCKAILKERMGIPCGASIPANNRLTDGQKASPLAAARQAGLLDVPVPAGV